MTERVDFYVLKSNNAKQRWVFACRLIEKAYLRDLRVVIVNDTPADAKALDDLLWTFNERSFVPHHIADTHITVEPAVPAGPELLVNLTAGLPAQWERYGRVAEIIDADEERRRLGRERFKAYRDFKVSVETHQLDESADG
ncbi:MAG TPA: DNA polymerase III subunit chi [Steroidobacteraceae bacterium]|jgi:DNA polymerase-3 subunit chi